MGKYGNRACMTVAVVGAGPAGLMAALQIGKNCHLFEKMSKPGIKLALTGNGRGNFTNQQSLKKFQTAYFEQGDFLQSALKNCSPKKLRSIFASLGLKSIEKEAGRVFPTTERAADITACLLTALEKTGVRVDYGCNVREICRENGRVSGIRYERNGQRHFVPAGAVVLACGGKSRPQTGSDGSGYELAKKVGHHCTPCLPALTPLLIEEKIVRPLQGLSFSDIQVRLISGNKILGQERGGVLFTHFGISGPAVLNLSRFAAQMLWKKETAWLELDFFPDMNCEELDKILQERIARYGKRRFGTILGEFLPERLVAYILERAEIDGRLQAARLTGRQRKRCLQICKKMSFAVNGVGDFQKAMLTCGGVCLSEIEERTLESKLVKGLYFAGEILDIDGKSGGYNLHAAFATGVLAGNNFCKDGRIAAC